MAVLQEVPISFSTFLKDALFRILRIAKFLISTCVAGIEDIDLAWNKQGSFSSKESCIEISCKYLCFRTFIFELYTDSAKLLGNMDIVTALSAFYHLCFSFDLRYPKVAKF